MYQLVTKKGKKFWLSKTEVVGVRKLLQQNTSFITLERYDKTINVYEILDVGVPDWAYPIRRMGKKIVFLGDTPYVIFKNHYLVLEEDKWITYEGTLTEKTTSLVKSFEDYIGEIKKLN